MRVLRNKLFWIISLLLFLGIFAEFKRADGHIIVNKEQAGVFFLRGGYHAYWLRYSYGQQYDPKTGQFSKNLWCRPYFAKTDLQSYLANLKAVADSGALTNIPVHETSSTNSGL